jgi:hypothetical protein
MENRADGRTIQGESQDGLAKEYVDKIMLDAAYEVLRRIPGVALNQTREIHR